jgi:sterol desaturase/sphingolipid hydroxylase (fatty acid hydroxylase superfamily)
MWQGRGSVTRGALFPGKRTPHANSAGPRLAGVPAAPHSPPMPEIPIIDPLVLKALLVAAWVAALFAAERVWPAAPRPAAALEGWPPGRTGTAGGWRRLGRNLGLWLVNTAISPLVVLPLTAWAAARGVDFGLRPAWWSGWGGFAADLLLLDFLIYWWHRANHVVPFLWRFHAVHHLDRFLDTTTALRFHFGEVLLSALARAAVIVILGIPFASVLAFEALVLVATVFHHSNIRLPAAIERAISLLVVTPSIHWVHHHSVRRDTDSNYATVLSLWDKLFASRSATRRRPDLPIGVEGQGEEGYRDLVSRPFRRG